MRTFPSIKSNTHVGAHIRELRLPVHSHKISSLSKKMELAFQGIAKKLCLKLEHPSSFGLSDTGSHMKLHLKAIKALPKDSHVMILDQGTTIPNDHPEMAKKLHHHWNISGATVARTAYAKGHKVIAVSKLPTSLKVNFVQPIDCVMSFADKDGVMLSATRIKLLTSGSPDSIYQVIFTKVHKQDPEKIILEDANHIKILAEHCKVKGTPASIIVTPPIIPDIEKDLFGLTIIKEAPESSKEKMDLVIVQHGGLTRTDFRNKKMRVEGEPCSDDGYEAYVLRNSKNPEPKGSAPRVPKVIPPVPTEGDYLHVTIDILRSLDYVKKGGTLIYSLDSVPGRINGAHLDPEKTIVGFLQHSKEYKSGQIEIKVYTTEPNKHQKSLIIQKIVK